MFTLRDVLAEYLRNAGNLPSARKLGYRVNCWTRHAPCELPITSDHVVTFQASAMAQPLSAVTINDTIADIIQILKDTGQQFPLDVKRLEEPDPDPQPPAVAEIGKLYSVADKAEWPLKWTQQERTWWWQAFGCLFYHWPLRNGDIFRITTENLCDKPGEQFPRVVCKHGRKTGALYSYPITVTCRRHLANLLRIKQYPNGDPADGNLFLIKPGSVRLVRDELKRLCNVAGIPEQTPKKIRGASLTSYECLDEGCGQLAHHGLSLGVRAHYVPHSMTMARKLWRHIPNFDVPSEMLDPNERRRNRESLAQLLKIAKRMPAEAVQRLSRIADAM